MLTHKNILSNVLQVKEWLGSHLKYGEDIAICALPLYHIFALTCNALTFFNFGANNILITNPRDIKSFVKELKKHQFTFISGVNTLFNKLLLEDDFKNCNFNKLRISLAGGMQVQKSVAEKWQKVTGNVLSVGYGLSETSPAASIDPIGVDKFSDTLGLPLPSTEISIQDDQGNHLDFNEPGEICIRGPQVMKGYWNNVEETNNVMTSDGWFKTGDIGIMNEEGYTKIVDRKKDMIIVSGFNVYPNEIEEIAMMNDKIFEAGCIGIKDKDGNDFKFEPPAGEVLPNNGYTAQDGGYEDPTNSGDVIISPTSERLAFLEPFPKMDPVKDYQNIPVLFKAKGKCTTDHISQAGPWLKFRGHLDNISNNMFLGATNAFHAETGHGNNPVTGEENQELNKIARNLKESGMGWVAVAEENIGEGSSREHAAMEPRHMGCLAFVANSYARIFEANLKKQGVLPFTFSNKADYDKIQAKDKISFADLDKIAPGKAVAMTVTHEDGSSEDLQVNHTLNDDQVKWFNAGSALNYMGSQK